MDNDITRQVLREALSPPRSRSALSHESSMSRLFADTAAEHAPAHHPTASQHEILDQRTSPIDRIGRFANTVAVRTGENAAEPMHSATTSLADVMVAFGMTGKIMSRCGYP